MRLIGRGLEALLGCRSVTSDVGVVAGSGLRSKNGGGMAGIALYYCLGARAEKSFVAGPELTAFSTVCGSGRFSGPP